MTYKIVMHGSEMCVYLMSVDPPQYLTLDDLGAWLRETRDDNPNLYAELVSAYVALSKATPPDKPANSSVINLSAITKRPPRRSK